MNANDIKVGGFYRARNNLRIEVVYTRRQVKSYPVVGLTDEGDIMTFTPEGSHDYRGIHLDWDLLAVWGDVIQWPWDLLPYWFKWCAFDEDGDGHAFVESPRLPRNDVTFWLTLVGSGKIRIPKEHLPPRTGDWQNSLTERPQS